ncbi:MAG: vitamin K epoxide reductase family protein [Candidatus Angelobacter sp.]
MRWLIVLVALVGLVAAALALREHYRTGTSPCSINEKWDCGTVNKSPYAVMAGIPVAVIGIAGYLLLAVLACKRWWRLLTIASFCALGFSLYLAHVEAHILEVWCIYCVISLGAISLVTLLSVIALVTDFMGRPSAAH